MRIGFLVGASTSFKLFGPIVEKALQDGLEVWLLLRDPPELRSGPKSYQRPDPGNVPAFAGCPHVERWDSDESLVELCRREQIEAVLSVWLYPRDYALCRALQAQGVRWVSLQHGTEHLILPPETLLEPDVTCMFSSFWAAQATQFFGDRSPSPHGQILREGMREKLMVTGCPELDLCARLDPVAIRRKYGIPSDRPVVLWLPHDYHAHDPWEMLVFRRQWHPRILAQAVRQRRWDLAAQLATDPTHARLMRSVRAFCDRANAFLWVKSRIKDRPAQVDRAVADLFTFDQSYYPATILEALAVADLCIHVLSVTVMEAAYAGVASLCLVPPRGSWFMDEPHTSWRSVADDILAPETLWHFPGMAFMLSVKEAASRLGEMSLADFRVDEARRRAYVERFVGLSDGDSASRVLQAARRDTIQV